MGNKSSSQNSSGGGAGAPPRRGPQEPVQRMTLKQGYDELVHAFIRPGRAEYSLSDLGPSTFRVGGTWFARRDISLINPRKLKLECSFWEPQIPRPAAGDGADSPKPKPRPCVIYLHGNSSCRAGALEMLPSLLMAGFCVFAMDFAGCGLSEGKYISLGYYEKDDVATAIKYLRECGRVSTIGLWGHSMGAATSMMFAHTDPSVAAMVLDCPFADLQQLAHELVKHVEKQGFKIPKAIASIALHFVRNSIKARANFDIMHVKPIKHAHESFIPAFFIAAEQDEMIDPHHSRDLHAAYGGDKNISTFRGQHCSPRPKYIHDSVIIFLLERMFVGEARDAPSVLHATVGGADAPWAGLGSGIQPQLHGTQSWLVPHAEGEEDELDELLEADADMLERAIIESLRDGGGVQEAEIESEPAAPATATESTATAAAAEAAAAKPEVSAAAPSSAAAPAAPRPVTSAELVQQGKSLEEIDDMLLQQALALSMADADAQCSSQAVAAASQPEPKREDDDDDNDDGTSQP